MASDDEDGSDGRVREAMRQRFAANKAGCACDDDFHLCLSLRLRSIPSLWNDSLLCCRGSCVESAKVGGAAAVRMARLGYL